jgi:hypothetical protein
VQDRVVAEGVIPRNFSCRASTEPRLEEVSMSVSKRHMNHGDVE